MALKLPSQLSPDDFATGIILGEARGEGPQGMLGVASVMNNRMTSGKFGDTIYKVGSKMEFNGFKDPSTVSPELKAQAAQAWQQAKTGVDNTGGALYFANPKTAQDQWAKNLTPQNGLQIGNHVFTNNTTGQPFKPAGVNYQTGTAPSGAAPPMTALDRVSNAASSATSAVKGAASTALDTTMSAAKNVGDRAQAAYGYTMGNGLQTARAGVDLQHVDPRLYNVLSSAQQYLPPGYTAKAIEGYNPGGHVANSMHHQEGKGAVDVQIYDDKGNAIPNEGNDPTGVYTRYATGVNTEMAIHYPEAKGQLAWGGAFGTVGSGSKNQTPDLMHFDLGGERGHYTQNRPSNLGYIDYQGNKVAQPAPIPNSISQQGQPASNLSAPMPTALQQGFEPNQRDGGDSPITAMNSPAHTNSSFTQGNGIAPLPTTEAATTPSTNPAPAASAPATPAGNATPAASTGSQGWIDSAGNHLPGPFGAVGYGTIPNTANNSAGGAALTGLANPLGGKMGGLDSMFGGSFGGGKQAGLGGILGGISDSLGKLLGISPAQAQQATQNLAPAVTGQPAPTASAPPPIPAPTRTPDPAYAAAHPPVANSVSAMQPPKVDYSQPLPQGINAMTPPPGITGSQPVAKGTPFSPLMTTAPGPGGMNVTPEKPTGADAVPVPPPPGKDDATALPDITVDRAPPTPAKPVDGSANKSGLDVLKYGTQPGSQTTNSLAGMFGLDGGAAPPSTTAPAASPTAGGDFMPSMPTSTDLFGLGL